MGVIVTGLLLPVVAILEKFIVSLLVVLLECASLPFLELSFQLLVRLICFLSVLSSLLFVLFSLGLVHLEQILFRQVEAFFVSLKAFVSFLD
jgi:hypothetical protein